MERIHSYDREVSISLETYKKFKNKAGYRKKYSKENILAGWYKCDGQVQLYRENGGFVDQLIFQRDNPHYKLQGYVFKGA